MRLYSFPLLVQEQILKLFQPHEVFIISLISKRLTRLIKAINWRSTGTCVDFRILKTTTTILLEGMRKDYGVVSWTFGNPHDLDIHTYHPIVVKLRDKSCNCSLLIDTTSGVPTFLFAESERNVAFQFIHNYVCDLFRTKPDLQAILDFNNRNDLPSTCKWENIVILGSKIRSKVLDDFFDNTTVENCVIIQSQIVMWLKRRSNLLKVNNLMTLCAFELSEQNLLQFQGIHGVFYQTRWPESVFITFIENWLQGKAPNLESIIASSSSDLDKDIILRHFQVEPWDPKKRQSHYPYRAAMRAYIDRLQDVCDCSEAVDIVRPADGARASISVIDNQFSFFLWKPVHTSIEFNQFRKRIYSTKNN